HRLGPLHPGRTERLRFGWLRKEHLMPHRWPLVALVALLAIPPLLVGAGPGPRQEELRPLRLIVSSAADAAIEAASAHGLFAAEGLQVEVTVTPSSTVQMRGLSDGTWDIASTAFDNVLAWSGREGAEIVAVAHRQAADAIQLSLFLRPEIRDW